MLYILGIESLFQSKALDYHEFNSVGSFLFTD